MDVLLFRGSHSDHDPLHLLRHSAEPLGEKARSAAEFRRISVRQRRLWVALRRSRSGTEARLVAFRSLQRTIFRGRLFSCGIAHSSLSWTEPPGGSSIPRKMEHDPARLRAHIVPLLPALYDHPDSAVSRGSRF